MKKPSTLSVIAIIGMVCLIYILYRLLLLNDVLPCSIYAVQCALNHWVKHWHIIVVGLLPVYIAIVIFGVLICGFSFGNAAHRWLSRYLQQK